MLAKFPELTHWTSQAGALDIRGEKTSRATYISVLANVDIEIDHVWVSRPEWAKGLWRDDLPSFSDHRPIVVEIEWFDGKRGGNKK